MKAIQIRHVPDDIHAVLHRRASDAGQSMQEYLLALIREHAGKRTVREIIGEARADANSSVTAEQISEWIREERKRG